MHQEWICICMNVIEKFYSLFTKYTKEPLSNTTPANWELLSYPDIGKRDGDGVMNYSEPVKHSPVANYGRMPKAVDVPVQTRSGEDGPLITGWGEKHTRIIKYNISALCVCACVSERRNR